MTTLNLGVIDKPYSFSEDLGKVKKGKTAGQQRVATTGAVAEILEEKYGIMEFFFTKNEKEIMALFEDALQGALESLLDNGIVRTTPFDAGCSQVEEMFRRFLDAREMDGQVKGVPTAAAKKGVNHRLGAKRGIERPSFIDTTMYQDTFKCWVD